MTVLGETKLGAWLLREKPAYFYKTEELRETVTGWLGYIVQTFPHYTRHTVDHSDNIVRQMSHLLFLDQESRPVVALSPIEAYVLIAAAYLHDSGMVVPDEEKRSILESEEWKRWIAGERWEKVHALRNAAEPADPGVRDFLADLYTRHLIAEFVRRVHHKRAARVVAEHLATFAHFSLKDPLVARTIADVCIGHGLSHNELKDPSRYPEQRQLAGEHANVRWMAILLRLGDLLDMRADRACPLLLNAAAPLPPESVVHWTQYQKLTQFLVTPKRIEIGAACDTRDEYQVLRDWTQWIEDEAKNAALVMMHAERHSEWKAPTTNIEIGRSPSARFLIDDWKFELDRDAVFDRLIHDVYDEPTSFIRELIQNALDATRVQMYLDLDADGIPRPQYPTQIDESRREHYPVEITLETRTVNGEERQLFTITDRGVGMDRDVINRYLLQIGRSYYTSDEFQRAFRFVPTSRFGVGFLSVFAVADEVTIDTYKPASSAEPIQLTLRGVRSYVLPQVGERRQRGTRIEVLLRKPIAEADAVGAIANWCRRVEVPIRLATREQTVEIRSEAAADFESHVPDLDVPGAEWHVRAYPFEEGGVAGEIYLESRSHEGVEEFGTRRYFYNTTHPLHQLPMVPRRLACLHGIRVQEDSSYNWSYRIDVRRPMTTTLSRTASARRDVLPEVHRALESILRSHFERCPSASGPDGWRYLQRLSATFEWSDFWSRLPMIPVETSSAVRLVTFAEVEQLPEIVTGVSSRPENAAADSGEVPSIAGSADWIQTRAISRRRPLEVRFSGSPPVRVQWGAVGGSPDFSFESPLRRPVEVFILPMNRRRIAMVALPAGQLILNRDHPLAEWMRVAARAVDSGTTSVKRMTDLLEKLILAARLRHDPTVDHWRGPSIPPELRIPPLVTIMPGVLGSPAPAG